MRRFLALMLVLAAAPLCAFAQPAGQTDETLMTWYGAKLRQAFRSGDVDQVSTDEFLAGFESWAKAKEEALKKLTEYLTRFGSLGEFLLGLLVFGLIPAVGEELVFRGVIQRQFIRWFQNPHVGIWVTALIFGAIHLQFYGMLPRTLLGALLGYLYWWSGNIWVPILGHFINNGFTVLMMYLLQRQVVDFDLDNTEAMPLPSILFSLAASGALLYFLQGQFRAWRALQQLRHPDSF